MKIFTRISRPSLLPVLLTVLSPIALVPAGQPQRPLTDVQPSGPALDFIDTSIENGSPLWYEVVDNVVRINGSASRELPGLTGVETPVAWIADGLLVMRLGDPSSPLGQIYRIDAKTGRQEPWKNILPRDRAGIMVLQTFRVTPDGHSHAYAWHRALSSLYIADGLT